MMLVDLDMQEQVITVDGVRVSLDLLRELAHPDEQALYRMRRRDEVTVVEVVGGWDLASGNDSATKAGAA